MGTRLFHVKPCLSLPHSSPTALQLAMAGFSLRGDTVTAVGLLRCELILGPTQARLSSDELLRCFCALNESFSVEPAESYTEMWSVMKEFKLIPIALQSLMRALKVDTDVSDHSLRYELL